MTKLAWISAIILIGILASAIAYQVTSNQATQTTANQDSSSQSLQSTQQIARKEELLATQSKLEQQIAELQSQINSANKSKQTTQTNYVTQNYTPPQQAPPQQAPSQPLPTPITRAS